MSSGKVISVCAVLLVATASAAAAQVLSAPFRLNPRQSASGATLNQTFVLVDFALTNRHVYDHDFVFYPTMVQIMFVGERARLSAGAGYLKGGGSLGDGYTLGVGAGYAVRRIEFLRQIGVELMTSVTSSSIDHPNFPDFRQIDIPFGVGATFVGPAPGFSASAWAVGFGQVRISDRLDPADDSRTTNIGGGLATGLMITLLNGFGFHTSVQGMLMDDEFPAESSLELLFSAGVHYRIGRIDPSTP